MEFDVDGGGVGGGGWGGGVGGGAGGLGRGWGVGEVGGGGVVDGLGEYCALGGLVQRGPESFSSISFDAGLRKQAPVWDSTYKEWISILLTVGNKVSLFVLVLAACVGVCGEENIFHWHSHLACCNPKHER